MGAHIDKAIDDAALVNEIKEIEKSREEAADNLPEIDIIDKVPEEIKSKSQSTKDDDSQKAVAPTPKKNKKAQQPEKSEPKKSSDNSKPVRKGEKTDDKKNDRSGEGDKKHSKNEHEKASKDKDTSSKRNQKKPVKTKGDGKAINKKSNATGLASEKAAGVNIEERGARKLGESSQAKKVSGYNNSVPVQNMPPGVTTQGPERR